MLTAEHSEGAVALTEEQTEGRGRLGRSWQSPSGVSLLFSTLLEPPVETARLPELTVVAGEAVREAIARVTGLDPKIKLPNDLLIEGRKTAGILAVFHYVPLHTSPVGLSLGYEVGMLPVTEAVSDRLLRLPMYAGLEQAEVTAVVTAVSSFYGVQ